MKLIDADAVAKILKIKRDSVRKLVQRGTLDIVTTTNQKNYFDRENVKILAKTRRDALRRKKNARLSRV